jgi:hypothetical protein
LDDLSKKIAGHIQHHNFEYLCIESYLQRLWTLQECLLSHTIEFVVGTDGNTLRCYRELVYLTS